jgi:anti-sigma factor RsiW
MKCKDAVRLIDAAGDGEARRLDAHSLKRHLATCRDCAARSAAAAALSARLRAELPRHPAPDALRARSRDLFATMQAAPRAAPRWPWFAGGVAAGCAATLVAWFVGTAAIDMRDNADVAVEAVTSHVRATLGNHLIQVASSDQHTVKPWLSARLDFSPQVHDLAGTVSGFVGGRIDYFDGHPAAALVYRERDHVINAFVWPERGAERPLGVDTLRGFNLVHWAKGGMAHCLVSDLNRDELVAIARKIEVADAGR